MRIGDRLDHADAIACQQQDLTSVHLTLSSFSLSPTTIFLALPHSLAANKLGRKQVALAEQSVAAKENYISRKTVSPLELNSPSTRLN